jgi:hypothetical protein
MRDIFQILDGIVESGVKHHKPTNKSIKKIHNNFLFGGSF